MCLIWVPLAISAIGSFIAGGMLTLPLLAFVPVPGIPAPIDYLYLVALAGLMSALTYVLYFGLVKSIGDSAQ